MQLQKGQKIKVAEYMQDGLFAVSVHTVLQSGQAVQLGCFATDEANKLSNQKYVVSLGKRAVSDRSMVLEEESQGAVFQIATEKLPGGIQRVVFFCSAEEGLKGLAGCSMNILEHGKEACTYPFSGADFLEERAAVLGELYKKDGVWRFSVVAGGFAGGLPALFSKFGAVGQVNLFENGQPPEPLRRDGGGKPANPVNFGNGAKPTGPVNFGNGAKPTGPVNFGNGAKPAGPVNFGNAEPASTGQPAPSAPSVVNLKKAGDTHKIDLSKNKQTLHVNLNWNQGKGRGLFGFSKNVDLDLACMFELKNGLKGVIQALGNQFGSQTEPPFIRLDQDDRTGTSTGGENMFFYKPEMIRFAVVFAYIYEGVPNWKATDASVTVRQQEAPDIEIHIDSSSAKDRFCVIASLKDEGNHLVVAREEKFFVGHREVDAHYGFGFRWVAGHK